MVIPPHARLVEEGIRTAFNDAPETPHPSGMQRLLSGNRKACFYGNFLRSDARSSCAFRAVLPRRMTL